MKNSISVCMIVKDEEEMIGQCLDSLVEWLDPTDEIIVVDTGSTDATIEIVDKYDLVKIYCYEWKDDFSAARNFSMSKATKEWILTMDADETTVRMDGKTAKRLLPDVEQNIIAVDLMNVYGGLVKGRTPQIRFFRRSDQPKYVGKVHNKPFVKPGNVVFRIPFKILHRGYDLPPEKTAEKHKRVVGMCRKLTEDAPDSPESWFHLARALRVKGKFGNDLRDEITTALGKALSLSNGKNDGQNIYIQAHSLLAWIKYAFRDNKAAIYHAKKALMHKHDYLDALLLLGLAYTYGVDFKEGERWLKNYLAEQEIYEFSDKMDSISMEYAHERVWAYNALIDIEKLKDKQLTQTTGDLCH